MNKGFIASTLVITVSSLLLVFSVTQSTEISGFFDMSQSKIYRIMNRYFAENCIDRAVLNISHDYFFETEIPIPVDSLHCVIDIVKNNNGVINIETHGNYKNQSVKKRATVMLYDNGLEIISIE